MGEELVEGISKKARRHHNVRLVGDHQGVPGRVLAMRFSRVDGQVVSLMGRLLEDGEVVAWFTAQRSSEKSGEICEVMEDIVDDLADDVADWLREPGRDALLGE
jgi:cellobiose phosphorylase